MPPFMLFHPLVICSNKQGPKVVPAKVRAAIRCHQALDSGQVCGVLCWCGYYDVLRSLSLVCNVLRYCCDRHLSGLRKYVVAKAPYPPRFLLDWDTGAA